jgi:hypothetical protein
MLSLTINRIATLALSLCAVCAMLPVPLEDINLGGIAGLWFHTHTSLLMDKMKPGRHW